MHLNPSDGEVGSLDPSDELSVLSRTAPDPSFPLLTDPPIDSTPAMGWRNAREGVPIASEIVGEFPSAIAEPDSGQDRSSREGDTSGFRRSSGIRRRRHGFGPGSSEIRGTYRLRGHLIGR
jgi:hypothetical protein